MLSGLEELLSDAPALATLLLVLGGATIFVGAASVGVSLLGRSARLEPLRRGLSWASLGLFVAFAVCLVALVEGARAVLVDLLEHPGEDGYTDAVGLARAISVQLNGARWGALIACLAAPASAFGTAAPWAFTSESKPAGRAMMVVAAVAGLLLVIAAGLTTAHGAEVILVFGAVAGADVTQKAAVLDAGMRDAATPFEAGAVVILAVGCLGAAVAIALAVRAAREGWVVGIRPLVGSGLILLVGVACFAGTRAMAFDAEHPVEPGPVVGRLSTHGVATPRLEACEAPSIAPIARITSAEDATLDNRIMDPSSFGQDLETMRRNWGVLHPREPFPGRVAVVADASLPMAEVAPWLRVARDAGYAEVDVLFERTRVVPTRSLGDLERPEACAVRFTLDPGGVPASRHRTWGDAARAAAGGDLRLTP